MRNLLSVLSILVLITACGKSGSGSSSSGPSINPIKVELTREENNLKEKLLQIREIYQFDLQAELIELSKLDSNSLQRLDSVLEIKCFKSTYLCHITSKE